MGHDITILIGGAAGQGIQTIGALLARICHNAGLYIFSYDDFQSRIRGGHSFHLLRISNQPLSAPRPDPDILVAIDRNTYDIHHHRLSDRGIALLNGGKSDIRADNLVHLPLVEMAREAGGMITANTVAAGAVAAILGTGFPAVETVVAGQFGVKGEKVLDMNLAAARKGYGAGEKVSFQHSLVFDGSGDGHVVYSGAQAAALGALAADCRFIPFYPMSPGTPIITHLSAYADRLPVVVEQAEDEIAAINMAIGASYAGVRSLTATSGGGFSLMVEGLGLAGVSETPVTIINAQRPGPATGLATRTAQADLLFTIHASQDDFPRFVFAPGSVLATYNAVKKAVMLAEKYQVPSIVLMDQFLVDSARTEPREFYIGPEHASFIETELYQDETYQRYRLTESGISPRILPCTHQGLVRVAGNEHNEDGFPDEDPDNRVAMMDKRARKLARMKKEMAMPSVFCGDGRFFLTGWGSTKGSIMEACLHLREEGINVGWVLFEDLWPLDGHALKALLANKKLIMVEGNSTSQLGALIRSLTGIQYFSSILKYDGRPMFPDYIMKKVKEIVGR